MNEETDKCQVCEMDKNVKSSAIRGGFHYECPRCGEYNIDVRLFNSIVRDWDEKKRMKFSALIRNYYEVRREPYRIEYDKFLKKDIYLPDYSVLEKQLFLLQNIERKTKYFGDLV